ncbi:hypothetical protein AWM75_00335 [Aerococcus urinaehominis]|uniref:Single-stranded-DNA-specific exonuclease RecJ n=1 Tax=Aerococcus urinaehominis TaxID=128944 RepID=A0A120IAM5_9LACT|nr:single-stranded-DNA-specific exonuclease RecJ [Aerococcus urinaehominis]AMB98530.1 hypothetical protein AWM75_00335 [Aerococcus urinaehominis]SDL79262.1 single-stranded-DNA-specific exonuclease [Aerococcus urinaehominis]
MLPAKYKWQAPDLSEKDLENIQDLTAESGENPVLVKLAYQRGYRNLIDLTNYLGGNPVFHDPFLFYDMERAVDRINQAIESFQSILIYGDYDADGITATTILYEALEAMGANVTYYLPNRFDDGYGPNWQVYKYYINQGIDLIITVDNGVAGFEALAKAKEAGVDVIVTDHHEISDKLPEAYAIIHPRHPQGDYPFDDLSGAGVALKLVTALMGEMPAEMLDVAAIGTVADLVSLTGENRALVQAGIQQLSQTERLGLQMLFSDQSLSPQQLDEEKIGFIIGPRLNALGRLGDASPGVRLLTSFDELEVREILDQIEAANQERKDLVAQITQQAMDQVDSQTNLPDIIIVSQASWHEGVLGIVASRLVETYQRPSIVLTYKEEDQVYKGSGRSLASVHLYQLLDQVRDLADKFGGHAMAAGMSVRADQFPAWADRLQELASHYHDEIIGKQDLAIDMAIPASQVNLANIRSLDKLRPFGSDNSQPRFLLEKQEITNIQALGKDGMTLKLSLKSTDHDQLVAIGFGKGPLAKQLTIGQAVDLVVSLSINEWNGSVSPQAQIIDLAVEEASVYNLRQAKTRSDIFQISAAIYLFDQAKYRDHYQPDLPKDAIALTKEDLVQASQEDLGALGADQLVVFDCFTKLDLVDKLLTATGIKNMHVFAFTADQAYLEGPVSRQDFAIVYRYLKGHPPLPLKGKEGDLAQYLKISVNKLKFILAVLIERGLAQWQGPIFSLLAATGKQDLLASPLFDQRQAQSQAEKFWLYQDQETIKRYFFEEDPNYEL